MIDHISLPSNPKEIPMKQDDVEECACCGEVGTHEPFDPEKHHSYWQVCPLSASWESCPVCDSRCVKEECKKGCAIAQPISSLNGGEHG